MPCSAAERLNVSLFKMFKGSLLKIKTVEVCPLPVFLVEFLPPTPRDLRLRHRLVRLLVGWHLPVKYLGYGPALS